MGRGKNKKREEGFASGVGGRCMTLWKH